MYGVEGCGFCGEQGEHKHYAVLCYEGTKRLGRLTPDGTTTNRNIFASIFGRSRADQIAHEINDGGAFRAKVIPF